MLTYQCGFGTWGQWRQSYNEWERKLLARVFRQIHRESWYLFTVGLSASSGLGSICNYFISSLTIINLLCMGSQPQFRNFTVTSQPATMLFSVYVTNLLNILSKFYLSLHFNFDHEKNKTENNYNSMIKKKLGKKNILWILNN